MYKSDIIAIVIQNRVLNYFLIAIAYATCNNWFTLNDYHKSGGFTRNETYNTLVCETPCENFPAGLNWMKERQCSTCTSEKVGKNGCYPGANNYCSSNQIPNGVTGKCEDCAAGKISNTNNSACVCAPGQQDVNGSCEDCTAGKYNSNGRGACSDCPAG